MAKNSTKRALLKKTPSTPEEKAQPTPETADKPYLRASAPGGPRRRAGHAFGPIPVDLTWEQLGADHEGRKAAIEALIADPLIAVAFYQHDGENNPGENDPDDGTDPDDAGGSAADSSATGDNTTGN